MKSINVEKRTRDTFKRIVSAPLVRACELMRRFRFIEKEKIVNGTCNGTRAPGKNAENYSI